MGNHKIYETSFATVYPHYVNKVVRKNKTEEELITIITLLQGCSPEEINTINTSSITFREFFEEAPKLHPNRILIKGVICGVRVEEVEDNLMKNIRYLDKLVDELSKGKKMDKILRN